MDLTFSKYLLLLSAVLVLVQADIFNKEEISKLKQYERECLKESGVDKAILLNLVQNKEYVDDPKLKQHILCCSKKLKLIDENGTINKEYISQKFMEKFKNKKVIDEAVKTCALMKDNPLDTTFEMTKCFHQYAPEGLDLIEVFKS